MVKKVLHVITGLGDGGAESVLTRLCSASTEANHVVVSLTDEGKYGEILRQADVPVYSIEMNPVRPNPFAFIRLVKVIRAESPDLVQTWMYHADLMGGVAARLAGVNRVFWSIRQSGLEKGLAKASTILVAKLCAKFSRLIPEKIVCCAFMAKEVHKHFGYCAEKLEVIPNGYDTSVFMPDSAKRNALRDEFGIADNEILLGMVGRFDPQKDHQNLLRALAILKSKSRPFRCLLVGSKLTKENLWLCGKLDELGLGDRVILAGARGDMPAVMNGLDIHILSSRVEGFPNVIAEAMACGTPCVSTDAGDAKLIIGDTGVVCKPADPEALAKGIATLIEEKSCGTVLWEQRKQDARKQICDRYSLDGVVMQYQRMWGCSG